MPIYEFKCMDCDQYNERLIMKKEDEIEMVCTHCGSGNLERILSRTSHTVAGNGGGGNGLTIHEGEGLIPVCKNHCEAFYCDGEGKEKTECLKDCEYTESLCAKTAAKNCSEQDIEYYECLTECITKDLPGCKVTPELVGTACITACSTQWDATRSCRDQFSECH
ncbi:MAG: hypothetical protein CR984_03915 [Proteobacteria bacterium]|nr:MAG: hypothetical protein CR984_03915 [Pseudomonadota bacterium]